MREVYPGFLQLTGFMTMNLDRHMDAHKDLYFDLVRGDGDGAQKHREFYDEYLSVMDLTAEFYLQTVDTVFIRYALAKGEMTHRGKPVDPGAIRMSPSSPSRARRTTSPAMARPRRRTGSAPNIPAERKAHYTQMGVGHYGVFNGSRFRSEIAPRIADFIRSNAVRPDARQHSGGTLVSLDAKRVGRPRRVPAAAE